MMVGMVHCIDTDLNTSYVNVNLDIGTSTIAVCSKFKYILC